jgi:hypothetical protein
MIPNAYDRATVNTRPAMLPVMFTATYFLNSRKPLSVEIKNALNAYNMIVQPKM